MAVVIARIGPLLIFIVVLAVLAWIVLHAAMDTERAKLAFMRVFTVIGTLLSVVFGLGTIYALLDGNRAVYELFGSCLIVGVLILAVTGLCRRAYTKHRERVLGLERRGSGRTDRK